MSSYKDLAVYRKSYKLALRVYQEVAKYLPEDERYGLTSQIKRAATSIPLNIAEGFAKIGGAKETLRFLQMARGSCAEMEVLLEMLKDIGYIDVRIYSECSLEYTEVGKMLTGLMKSITNN